MHLLPCPSCQASLPVAPSQAGNRLTCPECQSAVDVPKLGKLKQLPIDESHEAAKSPAPTVAEGRGLVFLILGLIGAACLLAAAYCGIRWFLIDASITSDTHVAIYREQYDQLTAAQLIREYEDMEKYGLELAMPYTYKKEALKKEAWGGKATAAGVVGLLAIMGAFLIGSGTRRDPA